jgi:hypoxanthine-guanine phosphoribosyltransferase
VIFLAPLDMIVRLAVKLTFLSVSSYNQHVGYVKVNIF